MATHRRLDPYALSRDAARAQARAEPRNARLLEARSLAQYAPQALRYPLYLENLVLVLGFGALQALIDSLLPEIWITALLPCALVVYLLEVIAHTSQGHGTAPAFTVDHLTSALSRALPAILVVLMVAVAIVQFGRNDEPGLALLTLAAASLLLPAQLGLLALTGETLASLDPRGWWRCIVAGGMAYALLVALTAVALASVAGIAPSWAAPIGDLPLVGGVALESFKVYAALAAAHLLGAAFHLRRGQLGLKVALSAKSDDESATESREESVARLLALADAEEDRRRPEAAVALLTTAPIGSHAPRPWLEDLFEGACCRPKPYFADSAGQRLVAHLVAEQQWVRALEIVVLAAQRWPRFQPASPEERLKLATQAFERGAALAFHRLTAEPETAGQSALELGFLAARWRAEREGDEAGARAMLVPLLAAASHPAQRRIAAYAAALDAGAPRRADPAEAG